ADVLAPGSGVGDEKALLGAMRELRDGNIERTVDALVAAKARAPAEARLAIDERIALLYLAAYRWGQAIAHADAHLFDARRSPHMSPAGRTYWIAVAHERRGDNAAAEAAYARARARSRGRPRVLIDQALVRLQNARPVELGQDATALVARVEAAAPPQVAA